MKKEDVARYLKFGFTEKMKYGEPVDIDYSMSWEHALEGFQYYYEEAIRKINLEKSICALSGGLDSSLNTYYLKLKSPLFYTYIIEGNTDHIFAEQLAKDWNLDMIFVKSDDIDLEQDLIKMNRMWKKPRCVTGDLHTYDAYRKLRQIALKVITGVGSETPSLGVGWRYGPIMETAIRKGEYDIKKARDVMKKSKYIDPLHETNFNMIRVVKTFKKIRSYSETIRKLFERGLFFDYEIKKLGLHPPEIKLRKENLSHAMQCTYDWFNYNMIGSRYPTLENELDIKFISPYKDEEFRKFNFSIPIEYRFCLGSERHVMRNFIADKFPNYIINRPREPFQPHVDWFFSNSNKISRLYKKYLFNKNLKIFGYIDYENMIQLWKYMNNYKKWALLNLSIWMEVRNEL